MDRLNALLAGLQVALDYELQQEAHYAKQIEQANTARNYHNARVARFGDAVRALKTLIRDCYQTEEPK
jgi:hypothetical protein